MAVTKLIGSTQGIEPRQGLTLGSAYCRGSVSGGPEASKIDAFSFTAYYAINATAADKVIHAIEFRAYIPPLPPP